MWLENSKRPRRISPFSMYSNVLYSVHVHNTRTRTCYVLYLKLLWTYSLVISLVLPGQSLDYSLVLSFPWIRFFRHPNVVQIRCSTSCSIAETKHYVQQRHEFLVCSTYSERVFDRCGVCGTRRSGSNIRCTSKKWSRDSASVRRLSEWYGTALKRRRSLRSTKMASIAPTAECTVLAHCTLYLFSDL